MSADETLLSSIEWFEEQSYGVRNDDLSEDRAKAIGYYLGKPLGNEVEGRSQVVSRDVADTIEWIKPSLLRIFTAGEEVVKFDPTGPEDEEAAKQETDYTNFVLMQKNPWFMVCYDWFSDALLTKNAYALAYWDKKKDTTTERYAGLTDDQMAMIAQDGVEIIAHEMMTDEMGQPLHVVEVKQVREYGCVQIEVLPPERCLVPETARGMSLTKSDFFEYWDHKTISDLRSMGFDVPDDIIDDKGEDSTTEDDARDVYGEQSNTDRMTLDPSMRRVRVRMCWIRHDYDGDGLAEIRYVVAVGRTILHNQDVSCIPVVSIVPVPMPHRHIGNSVYDLVHDIQEIKTAIMRQVLDNLYLQNNGRHAISDKVNLDDMLTSRPGGIVRVAGIPGNEIMPLVHPFVAQNALAVAEYFDSVRENRTGTNRYFTGVDQNALNKTASGIAQLTSSAAQRVELIARIFAEGVKELFGIVHELTLKHATQAEKVKLRGQWVHIDPRQWKKRYDMTPSVGMGTGNREQVAAGLMNILMAQKEALPMGITEPSKVYNALAELTKAYGFSTPEKFWTEPPPGPLPPPPPDPKVMLDKDKLEHEKHKARAEIVLDQERIKIEREQVQVEREKLNVERAAKLADLELKRDTEAVRMAADERRHDKELVAKQKPAVNINGKDVNLAGKDDVQAIGAQFAAIAEQAQQQQAFYAESLGALIQQMTTLMTAERELVRDKSGKAIGTKIKAQ